MIGLRPHGPSSNRPQTARILAMADELHTDRSVNLIDLTNDLKWTLRCEGQTRPSIDRCFAIVVEAIRSVTGLTLYPVQIQGGLTMARRGIAEMQTGEGKTLTAILPATLFALSGKGCHVVTSNDYLAGRDAEELQPVYAAMGLSVGCVIDGMDDEARAEAYACDITYGTSKEMGFDFLRDCLRGGPTGYETEQHRLFSTGNNEQSAFKVQRGHFCAIVDEADSVLIDDAQTPLLIGVGVPQDYQKRALYRWSHEIARELIPEIDFSLQPKRRKVVLTESGCRRIMLAGKPAATDVVAVETLFEHVERALEAGFCFECDKHYTVKDEEIVLLGESTGRIMEGRKLQQGLHHALEVKEGLPITTSMKNAAQISVQGYFRKYRFLAGMTGTARNARKELRKVYKIGVTPIPTHRPCIRNVERPRVFATQAAKRNAVLEDVVRRTSAGRPVLIGTPSVQASEALAELFYERGVKHFLLNAQHEDLEASIVAHAGTAGTITIATNMAGRGTDIRLDDEALKAGGLHVIATEMHTSARIDRQLAGRSARQGDPGSFQQFLSLEDELLAVLTSNMRARWQAQARPNQQGEISTRWVGRFRKVQRQIERQAVKGRGRLLKQDVKQNETYERLGLNPYLESATQS